MSKELQKKINQKREKAAEMSGKKITKSFPTKAIAVDKENKTATFIMSTESIDRHGDIVDQESINFNHFTKNPAFYWQHQSNDFPLGSWEEWWQDENPEIEGTLMTLGKARFDTDIEPNAERAFNHVERGNLRMVSIGFIPHRVDYDEEKDAFILYDCELLECSLVGIGSNRDALITDAEKSAKNEKEDVDNEAKEESAKDKAIDAQRALQKEILDEENRRVYKKHKAHKLISQAIRNL